MRKTLLATLIATSLFATDYTSMTLDELNALKGTIATEDRDAFKSAMQSKMMELTPEQKAAVERGMSGTKGQGTIQRLRDGSGAGGMYKGSRGGKMR
jgi:hypothetical protein